MNNWIVRNGPALLFLTVSSLALAVLLRRLLEIRPETWQCGYDTPPPDPGVSTGFIVASVGAFAVGNIAGRLRQPGTLAPESTADNLQSRLFRIVMTVLFATVAALLLYETFGQWMVDYARQLNPPQDSPYWPITWYVRCGTEKEMLPTLGFSVSISWLFGHWLHRRPEPAAPLI